MIDFNALTQLDSKQILDAISDYLPALVTLSPVTMVGAGVAAAATLLYLFTKAPEFLLVVFTAVAYSAVPLLPRIS